VRYFDATEGSCRFELLLNGVRQGESWTASSLSGDWQSHTIQDVAVQPGDAITINAAAEGKHNGGLDYVQFKRRPNGSTQK
jgi:hypothetical protein